MNVSFIYHKTHFEFICYGLIAPLSGGSLITAYTISSYSNLYLDSIETRILINILCIIIPILINLGLFLIIKTKFHHELQFSETNFKYYKNSKLKIDVPIEEVSGIFITHKARYDDIEDEIKIIEIEINGRKKIRLVIAGTKTINRFVAFAGSLKNFCYGKKITFQNPKIPWYECWDARLQEKKDSLNSSMRWDQLGAII